MYSNMKKKNNNNNNDMDNSAQIVCVFFFLFSSQSQLEVMEKSLSPEEFQELSQSILLSGKQPCSKTVISQGGSLAILKMRFVLF